MAAPGANSQCAVLEAGDAVANAVWTGGEKCPQDPAVFAVMMAGAIGEMRANTQRAIHKLMQAIARGPPYIPSEIYEGEPYVKKLKGSFNVWVRMAERNGIHKIPGLSNYDRGRNKFQTIVPPECPPVYYNSLFPGLHHYQFPFSYPTETSSIHDVDLTQLYSVTQTPANSASGGFVPVRSEFQPQNVVQQAFMAPSNVPYPLPPRLSAGLPTSDSRGVQLRGQAESEPRPSAVSELQVAETIQNNDKIEVITVDSDVEQIRKAPSVTIRKALRPSQSTSVNKNGNKPLKRSRNVSSVEKTPTGNSAPRRCETSEEYTMEALVGWRICPETLNMHYRVRWTGYGPEADTWESEDKIREAQALDLVYKFYTEWNKKNPSDVFPITDELREAARQAANEPSDPTLTEPVTRRHRKRPNTEPAAARPAKRKRKAAVAAIEAMQAFSKEVDSADTLERPSESSMEQINRSQLAVSEPAEETSRMDYLPEAFEVQRASAMTHSNFVIQESNESTPHETPPEAQSDAHSEARSDALSHEGGRPLQAELLEIADVDPGESSSDFAPLLRLTRPSMPPPVNRPRGEPPRETPEVSYARPLGVAAKSNQYQRHMSRLRGMHDEEGSQFQSSDSDDSFSGDSDWSSDSDSMADDPSQTEVVLGGVVSSESSSLVVEDERI